jgi:putative SOS response-associated peptidase YedK
MCYHVESATLQAIKYAIHRGNFHLAEELQRKLDELLIKQEPRFHVSGFAHPQLIAFRQQDPYSPSMLHWGLIPMWTRTGADAKKARTQTLNARGETIFEKPSFKNSAKNKRCIIYLDAFYEHHHANKQTYPFRISMKDGSPMAVAGLWEEWADKETGEIFETCTIVTTTGNELLSRIHNNDKAEMGPRMPVILTKEEQDLWLSDCKTPEDVEKLRALIKPCPDGLLQAHTVGRLVGKNAVGNKPEVRDPVIYDDLPWK